jgi:hypothetical protein
MRRIKSIVMHPDSTGKDILPGNYVIKVNERTGAERKVILEHEMGYFWALKVRNHCSCILFVELKCVC